MHLRRADRPVLCKTEQRQQCAEQTSLSVLLILTLPKSMNIQSRSPALGSESQVLQPCVSAVLGRTLQLQPR